MIRKSISNMELLKLIDQDDNRIYYGCDQDWYPTKWQRQSGCGPTTACNILLYWKVTRHADAIGSKEEAVSFMEEVWTHITPTYSGISNTKMFIDHLGKYAKVKGFHVVSQKLDIPMRILPRAELDRVVAFIAEALEHDMPVAFLNLSNGKVRDLDSWHWVTIAAIEYSENASGVWIHIVDGGGIKKINFKLWYETSRLGGGLIYLNFN